jgi:hypothetical protein
MSKTITDPFGNEIIIHQIVLNFVHKLVQSGAILDDIDKVIEKPALLLKMNGGKQLYYLRAVGWHKTMLVEAQKNNSHFEVIDYKMDPLPEYLKELYDNGERLI